MVRRIEHVWCFLCGFDFFIDKTNDNTYLCPKCGKKISFETETCRYIINK